MAFKNGIFTRGGAIRHPKLKGVSYLGDDEPIYPEDLEAWKKVALFAWRARRPCWCARGRWLRVEGKGR